MKDLNTKIKNKKIEIRVNEKLKTEISELADSLGLTTSGLMLLCYKLQFKEVYNKNIYDTLNE